MAVRNVFTGRQMRQHALPDAAEAGFCLKFAPSASHPDKRGSRYAALTAAAAAAWLSLYPWAEAQADDAPSYTEIDQYHGEFSTKDGGTFSYLPDAGKFEGPGDKPVTPTGTDAPHNYLIELNGTHLTATGTDSSRLNPSELRILNSDEGTVSTNKLTYYTGSSAYASAGAADGGSITFVRSRLGADNNIFDFTGTELSASGSAQSVPDGHEPIFSSLTFADSLQGASNSNTVTMNNGSTQNSSVTLTGGASAVFVSGAAGAASNTITLNGTALSAEGASKDGRVYGDITLISSSGGSVSGSTVTMENRSSQASSVTLTGGASAVFVSGAAGAASNTITLNGTTLSAGGVSEGGCVYGGITLVRSSEGSVSGSILTVNTATLKATGGTAIDFVSSASDAVSNTITLNETNLSAEGVSEDGNVYGGISLVSSADGSVSGSTLEINTATLQVTDGASVHFINGANGVGKYTIGLSGADISAKGIQTGGSVYGGITLVESYNGIVSGSGSKITLSGDGSGNRTSLSATDGASISFVSGAKGAEGNTIELSGSDISAKGVQAYGSIYGGVITLISSSEGSVSDSTLKVNTDSNGKRTTMTASDGASIHFINGANGVEKYTIGLDGADISAAGAQAGGSVYGDITLVESSHGIVSGSGSKITLSRDGSGNRTSLAATDGASVYFVNGTEGAEGNTIELNGADISAKGVQADGRVYGGAITLIGSSDGTASGSKVNLHSDGSGAGTTLKATDGASIHLVSGAKGAEGNGIEINGAAITADGDQADGVTYGSSSLIESLSGTATDNEVYLHSTGSSITSFQIQDGADMKLVSGAGGVSGNHVKMSGAILGVTGGGTLSAVSSSGGTAEGNTVEVLTTDKNDRSKITASGGSSVTLLSGTELKSRTVLENGTEQEQKNTVHIVGADLEVTGTGGGDSGRLTLMASQGNASGTSIGLYRSEHDAGEVQSFFRLTNGASLSGLTAQGNAQDNDIEVSGSEIDVEGVLSSDSGSTTVLGEARLLDAGGEARNNTFESYSDTSYIAKNGASIFMLSGETGASENTIDWHSVTVDMTGAEGSLNGESQIFGEASVVRTKGAASGNRFTSAGSSYTLKNGASLHVISGPQGVTGNSLTWTRDQISVTGSRQEGEAVILLSDSGSAEGNIFSGAGVAFTADGAGLSIVTAQNDVSRNNMTFSENNDKRSTIQALNGASVSVFSARTGKAAGNNLTVTDTDITGDAAMTLLTTPREAEKNIFSLTRTSFNAGDSVPEGSSLTLISGQTAEGNNVSIASSDFHAGGNITGIHAGGNSQNDAATFTDSTFSSADGLAIGIEAAGSARDDRFVLNGGTLDLSSSLTGISASAITGSQAEFTGTVTGKAGAFVGMEAEGKASGNKAWLTALQTDAPGAIYGTRSGADAENNTLTVTGGSISADIYAAAATGNGAAVHRSGLLIDNGAQLTGSRLIAGFARGDVTGSTAIFRDSYAAGSLYGGYSDGGTASGNEVTVESGTIDGAAVGGSSEKGTASGNSVHVKGGTLNGGAEGGHTGTGDATGNTVLIDSGTVLDHIYGGFTGSGSATGNFITVTGGTVNAVVAGGYDDGTATDNTVTLYDTAVYTGSGLYDGLNAGPSSDVFTDNTLNVHGQIQAATLQNFQNLNFYDVADDTASVDLSKSAVIGDGKNTITNVAIVSLKNQTGDIPEEYVLVHTPAASSSFTGTNLYVNGNTVVTIGPDGSYVPYSGTVANDGTMDNATGSAGMTKSQYGIRKGFLTFDVDFFIKNGQDLIARWKKNAPVEVDPETEQFSATRQASAALMDEGADFVAGEGIDRALQASQCLPGEPCGAKAFMAVNGGYSTFKAGTTINMGYGNLVAGLARQCKIGPMGYLAGAFFETGLGRFHSEYETDNSRAIDSEGHDYYYGVGALAKVFLNRDALRGLYAEGSIRYGLMMSDWQSHDISISGRTADWDGRAPYLTAHGGLGYMWDVTDDVTADVYAKYFWGHLWGDDGTICGQKFEFDDIYSSRVRTGARLNFKKDETFSWYLGGAWEHQFDAKSTGSIYGYDVPSTDLRGNTAIAEAGIYFRPKADSDFSFMLGTTGYFGEKREGVTGHLQVRYEF